MDPCHISRGFSFHLFAICQPKKQHGNALSRIAEVWKGVGEGGNAATTHKCSPPHYSSLELQAAYHHCPAFYRAAVFGALQPCNGRVTWPIKYHCVSSVCCNCVISFVAHLFVPRISCCVDY